MEGSDGGRKGVMGEGEEEGNDEERVKEEGVMGRGSDGGEGEEEQKE